ncbi:MAG TPA: hypothetical protein VKR83_04785 [Ktedonobacteraceae bacterium]|nr:hypothetical protein [Ktedonobacteraceae bacterium]
MANATRMLALTRLRYESALYGHAVPFGGVTPTIGFGGVPGKFSGPVFATNGRSMPISRGSPPFYDE